MTARKAPETFLVWNPDGYQPRFEHPSYDTALAEAKRLAGHHPGQKFYVLVPAAMVQVRDPVEVTVFINADDGIPF